MTDKEIIDWGKNFLHDDVSSYLQSSKASASLSLSSASLYRTYRTPAWILELEAEMRQTQAQLLLAESLKSTHNGGAVKAKSIDKPKSCPAVTPQHNSDRATVDALAPGVSSDMYASAFSRACAFGVYKHKR